MKYKKILIAVDASEFSFNSALKTMDFFHERDVEIGLVSVIETLRALHSPELGNMAIETIQKAKIEVEEILNNLIASHKGPKEKVVKFFPEGNPWEKIIEVAESWPADMISLSTHGRTGFLHLLMGSVAESVVQHAKVPVLVFPAKADK